MARLFKDGAGATYDASVARFLSVPFGYTSAKLDAGVVVGDAVNPGGAYEPFNFGSEAALLQKVDMSAAGNAMDCGECHVGGGTMEYLPGSLVSLRDVEQAGSNVPGYPDGIGGAYTAFNYVIDQYDVDGDGVKFEAQHVDYTKTGTVEMDCFICHLNGYKYAERKEAIRAARFDATRPVGAGIAAPRTELAWDTAGYGTAVVYDPTKVVAVNASDPSQGYVLAGSVASNIMATPPTSNCSHCHFDEYAVDWKKRGDSLAHDVHYGLGCMACHERSDKDIASVGTSGGYNYGADSAKLGLCDPAKGGASPFDALANNFDEKLFKDCAGCHDRTVSDHYNAPVPTEAHAAKGLTGHLAYISCEACHVKKAPDITGGSFVDGTGLDHEGRVADHEHHDEAGQTDRVAMAWGLDGKLHPVNLHTSFFIRGKNDRAYDLNADGRAGGVDGILQTHMAEVTGWNAANALFADKVVTSTEINNLFLAIEDNFDGTIANLNGLPVPGGAGFSGIYPKLSYMTVPFKNSHNIARSSEAWGSGGCTDCHGADKGFYNGIYDLNAGYSIEWSKSTQMSPMTKVNGFSQPTYTHPNVKDKWTGRSIAVDSASATGLRNVDRAEFIYETTFKTLDTSWKDEIVGGAISFPAAPASFGGSLLRLQATNDGGTTVVTRTFSASTNPADVAALISHFGTFATAHEFDITGPNANGGITITPKSGYQVRLTGNADGASYNLPQYVDKPRVGVNSTSYPDRSSWVAYLNTIGQPPVANVANVAVAAWDGSTDNVDAGTYATAVSVTQGATINLAAMSAGADSYTYSWTCSDGGAAIANGQQTTRVFAKAGTFTLTLTARNTRGEFASDTVYVKVVAPAPVGPTAVWTDVVDGDNFTGTLDLSGLPTHTRVYILWGDYTANTWDNGTGDHSVAHAWRVVSSKLVDTDGDLVKDTYRYTPTIRVYNGSSLVKMFTATVDIPKP